MTQLYSQKKHSYLLTTVSVGVSLLCAATIAFIGYVVYANVSSTIHSLDNTLQQTQIKRDRTATIAPVFDSSGFITHLLSPNSPSPSTKQHLSDRLSNARDALLSWQKSSDLTTQEAELLLTVNSALFTLEGAFFHIGTTKMQNHAAQINVASEIGRNAINQLTINLDQSIQLFSEQISTDKQTIITCLGLGLFSLILITVAIARLFYLNNLFRRTVTFLPPAQHDLPHVFNHLPEAALVLDEAGGILFANDQACALTDYAHGQLLPMNIDQLLDADDAAQLDAILDTQSETSIPNAILRLIPLNKAPIMVSIKAVVQEINRAPLTLVTMVSVEAQHKHIQRFAQHVAMFNQAQIGSNYASWHWELASDQLIWSDQLYRLFGYEPQEIEVSNDTLINHIPKEEREMVSNAINEALVFAKPYNISHHIMNKDGKQILIEQSAIIDNEQGKASTITSSITEVIPQTNNSNFDNVFVKSADALVVTDKDGKISQANDAFAQLTGYSNDSVIGKPITKVSRGDYFDKSVYSKIWRTLEKQAYWEGELWNTKQDGVVYPTWQRITNLDPTDNTNSLYLWTIRDMTEERHINELLSNHSIERCTKLPSRNVLFDRISQAIKRHERDNKSTAVILISIDATPNLSTELLVSISNRLKDITRSQDSIARFGMHEFIIVLEGLVNPEDAYIVSDKIAKNFETPFNRGSLSQKFDCNVGIAMHPLHSANDALLINYADAAMQYAKANNDANIQVFNQKILNDYNETQHLNNQLQRAIDLKELSVQFQPMMDLRQQAVSIAVAHIRWHHAAYNTTETYRFINAAKNGKLREPLHFWLLENALAQATLWPNYGLSGIKLQIKVVKEQLLTPGLSKMLKELIDVFQYAPSRLIIELEAHSLLELDDVAQNEIKQLKAIGIAFTVSAPEEGPIETDKVKDLTIDTVTSTKQSLTARDSDAKDMRVREGLLSTIKSHNIYASSLEWTKNACTITIGDIKSKQHTTFLVSDSIPNEKLINLAHILKSKTSSTQSS